MDKETKSRIADFFTPWELAEFLQLDIDDFIDRYEDRIEESLDEIEEWIGVRDGKNSD